MLIRKKENSTQSRGFTLTELAVVLGAMGLILGAIWVASGIVADNRKTYLVQQEIGTVAQNIREYYMGQQGIPNACGTDVTQTLIAKGIFPSEMQTACTTCPSGYQVDHPYTTMPGTGSVRVISSCPNGASHFRLVLTHLPITACTKIVTREINYQDQSFGIKGICLAGDTDDTCGIQFPNNYEAYGWNSAAQNNDMGLFVGGFYYQLGCVNGICGLVRPGINSPSQPTDVAVPALQDVENGCTLQPASDLGLEFSLH